MNYNVSSMSINEKIKLAEELWKSIEEQHSAPLTPSQQQLLEQRLRMHKEDITKGRSWKEIRKKYFN